jgi:hypothetical protein
MQKYNANAKYTMTNAKVYDGWFTLRQFIVNADAHAYVKEFSSEKLKIFDEKDTKENINKINKSN